MAPEHAPLTVGAAPPIDSAAWRLNVFAVTAASFMDYTGFTLADARSTET
jgi:hypothetical protein